MKLGLVSDTDASATLRSADPSSPRRGSLRLGLVSDTHDNVALARVAASWLRERADHVVHVGDITTRSTAALFHDALLLRGNNDPPALGRAEWEETLAGVRVGAHHGHEKWRGSEVDLLLHGHSHRMRCERVGRTLVVNPGALQRALVKTIALVALPEMRVEFHEVTPEHVAPFRPG